MEAPSRSCAAFCPAISAVFLIALGSIGGIAHRHDLGAGAVERFENGGDRPFRIDDDRLAVVLGQRALEFGALVEPDPLPRCCRTSGPIFSDATNRSAVPSAWTKA